MSLGSDLHALARHLFRVDVESRFRKPREARSGVCAFCGEPGNDLVIDHDHDTGRNRGLVHPACNAAIGVHTRANLERLVSYLNRDVDLGRYPKLAHSGRNRSAEGSREVRDPD